MRLFRNTIAVLAMMLPVHQMSAWAQNMSYGADNFYRSDIVTVTPITFQDLYRTTIQGNLFTRNNLSRSIESPAIIVGHPMSAVKEQSAKFYATKLAEQGFVTVSLDLPFWGASGGEPRNGVSPDIYAEAYSAAVDYLGTQSFVDRERIGIFATQVPDLGPAQSYHCRGRPGALGRGGRGPNPVFWRCPQSPHSQHQRC
ncbi:hypothetical protein ABZX51_003987 [Aspergillus tubingensis]